MHVGTRVRRTEIVVCALNRTAVGSMQQQFLSRAELGFVFHSVFQILGVLDPHYVGMQAGHSPYSI